MSKAAALTNSSSQSHIEQGNREAQPVAETERIVSIDTLRGFALLGILPLNIQYFSMISAAYWNPTAYGNLQAANLVVWLLGHILADGKFMTIFSMLFGAGILLMTSRVEDAGMPSAALHYRRMGWLILFGVAHSFLLWSGDILYSYGMCGFLVYLCRKLRPRVLILTGLLSMTVASAYLLTGYGLWSRFLPPNQVEAVCEQFWNPKPAMVAKELAAYRGTWSEQMRYRVPDSLKEETAVFAAFTFWRVTGLMLVGMALFKLEVFSARRPRSLYWKMIAAALCVGIPATLYGTYRDFSAGWDYHYSLFYGMQFNYWASVVISLGWVGAIMLAYRTEALFLFMRRLAAVGRMAFTNYIMQTVICTTMFYGHGLGLFGKVERVWQFAIVVVIWAVQLVVSPIWLRHFSFGPLEWLWRSLTYLQWEPFRRYPVARQIAPGC